MSSHRQYGFDPNSDNNNPSYQPYKPDGARSGGYQVSSGPSYHHPHIDRSHTASPPSPTLAPLGGHPGLPAFTRYNSDDSQPSPTHSFPQGFRLSPTRSNEQRASPYHSHHQQPESEMSRPQRRAAPVPLSDMSSQDVHSGSYSIPAPPPLARGLGDRPAAAMHPSDRDQDTSYYPPQQQGMFDQDTAYHSAAPLPLQQQRQYSSSPDAPPSPPRHAVYPSSPYGGSPSPPNTRGHIQNQSSYSSTTGLAATAAAPALASSDHLSTYSYSRGYGRPESFGRGYSDYPSSYHGDDSRGDLGSINPMEIADDDHDDGFVEHGSRRKQRGSAFAGAGAAGAAAGAGNFLKGLTSRNASGNYGQVPGGGGGSGGVGGSGDAEKGAKSAWLSKQTQGSNRLKWMVGGLIGLVIVLAIIGGAVGAVLTSKNASNSSGGGDSSADGGNGSNLNKDSPQVQKLLNNPDLHKVFPGMDYTPLNSMYPECLKAPPTQNNITMDVAVLTQLTNQIRLYGTDCGVVDMTMQAIENLGLQDSVKVWLGIWQDDNSTTNARQLQHAYDALGKWGADGFAGVIVGNEVLFRKDMSETDLISVINDVRSELKKRNMNLPVATSDLGSNWNAQLASAVDIVMGNIHPFFAGIPVEISAAWTWQFWQDWDVKLTAGTDKKNLISEVGWPSQGGNDCGTDDAGKAISCANSTAGSVAGTEQMNLFMGQWICQALSNQTDYFWFEAFDEPWKVRYNTPTEGWEDHWGLFDINRNLKDGVQIPDCGGQTVS